MHMGYTQPIATCTLVNIEKGVYMQDTCTCISTCEFPVLHVHVNGTQGPKEENGGGGGANCPPNKP